jgi:glycosyltransferase involved in cell wall biosynthesis
MNEEPFSEPRKSVIFQRMLSVIVPAYNEEKLLPATLAAINDALSGIASPELIVVDNESTDDTRNIAITAKACIVDAIEHNISHVRNSGAAAAHGDALVFIDADTIVRRGIFEQIERAMAEAKCLGGSVAVEYEMPFRRSWMRFFMRLWVLLGRFTKMRQGALQYCRADVFRELDGYDEAIYVGEDIEFHWRLDKLAKKRGGYTAFITEPAVTTSSRRWDRMGLVRMLFFTHPVTIFLAWRKRSFWKDWYDRPIR